MNRNKRSVALDLREEADRRRAAELARRADVLFENFRPGTLRKYGLGYDEVEGLLTLGQAAGYATVQPVGAVTVGLKGERLAELGAMAASRARV